LTIYDLVLLAVEIEHGCFFQNHQSKIVNHSSIGVSRITAWLTQASDKVLPGRASAVSVTTFWIYDLRLIIYDLASRGVETGLARFFIKSSIKNHQSTI